MKKKANRDRVEIGETLETNDIYLPHKKTPERKRRPVIAVETNSKGEMMVIPGSTRSTSNTSYYGKHGIKYYRHNVEVVDNDNEPIKLNEKFIRTKNSKKLPRKDVEKIKDKVINHTRFSSENKKKQLEFRNRNKKSKN